LKSLDAICVQRFRQRPKAEHKSKLIIYYLNYAVYKMLLKINNKVPKFLLHIVISIVTL